MTEKEPQIVAVKVVLGDGSEIEPSCWAVAFLTKGEGDKLFTNLSWSRREHSPEEIVVLGVAIERLLGQYNEDDAIKGALRLLESEHDPPV